jgi:hypothetical protein
MTTTVTANFLSVGFTSYTDPMNDVSWDSVISPHRFLLRRTEGAGLAIANIAKLYLRDTVSHSQLLYRLSSLLLT